MANSLKINKAIEEAYSEAKVINADVNQSKWIVFSDHHRGRRDGADDFVQCETAYIQALNYYLERDYNLVLLGDVEEFWENPFDLVLKRYDNVLQLEKQFHLKGKLHRIWGNHDDNWRFKDFISKHLDWLLPDVEVSEALRLKLNDKETNLGEILLIHGHQGTLESDRFAFVSKVLVRYLWRNFQRIFSYKLSTPAKDTKLKSNHDKAMHAWASKREKQLIICGHTHDAVFMSKNKVDKLMQQLDAFDDDEDSLDYLLRKHNISLDEKGLTQILPNYKPCYFNAGCCSYSDGDITGIDISNGKIQLVRWDDSTEEEPIVKEVEDLSTVFGML